jgi:CRISPR-associated protein Cas5d
MFLRRAEKGQCFHRPYLGCREFAADFAFIRLNEPLPESIPESRDLGWMLHDIQHDNRTDKDHVHFCTDSCRPSFFRAVLKNGVLLVPTSDDEEVRQ